MKLKNLIAAIALAPSLLHGTESDYFTLDTRGESFAIADFDSKACHGAYHSVGGRTAYLLSSLAWTGYYKLTFTAHPKSDDIVKYEYFINGVSQGVPSSLKTYDLQLVGRSVGDVVTVVGYDDQGTPTKEFRANIDVITAPPLISGSLSKILWSSRDDVIRYSFGKASGAAQKSFVNYSCDNKKQNFFPTFGGSTKIDSSLGGGIDFETEFNSDGAGVQYWTVGAFGKNEVIRTDARDKKGRFKKWGRVLGADVSAGLKLDLCWQWQPTVSDYEFSYLKGGAYFDFDITTPDLRPAFFPALYLNASIGMEGDLGFKKKYQSFMCTPSIWDDVNVYGVLTPKVTLRGGLGKKNCKIEAHGTGRGPIAVEDDSITVSLVGDFGVAVEVDLWIFELEKDFKLWQGGPIQIYPSSTSKSCLSGSEGLFTARPLSVARRNSHLYDSPLRSKAESGDEFILAADVPLEPPSKLIASEGGICWLQVSDDSVRDAMNASTVMLYEQTSNDTVRAETIWDDGTNDFEPHLLKSANGDLVAIWANANCSWQGLKDYTAALKSLQIVCATKSADGNEWITAVVTPESGYYHDISAAYDEQGELVMCWVANEVGTPFATSEAPDTIMAVRRVGGVWQPPEVVVANAGSVDSGVLDYQGGQWIYVYSVEDLSETTQVPRHKLMCARTSGNTSWRVEELVSDDKDNCSPLLSHDATGRSVLVWTQGGDLAVSYDLGATCSIIYCSGQNALCSPEFVSDADGNLCGVQLLASPTNMVTRSREFLFSQYDAEFGRWSSFAPVTDNDIIERNPRGIVDVEKQIVRLVFQEDTSNGDSLTNRYGILRERVYSIGTDLALSGDVEFENDLTLGSNTTVWVTIENRGLTACAPTNGVLLRMYRSDSVVAVAEMTEFPAPGSSVKIGLPWRVAMSSAYSNLTFRLDEDRVLADINRSNNEFIGSLPSASLRIDSFVVRNGLGNEKVLTAYVVNDGLQYSADGEQVTFRKDSEDGEILGSGTLPSISVGDEQQCAASLKIDVVTLNLTSEYTKVYAILSNSVKSAMLVVRKDTDGDGLSDDEEMSCGSDKTLIDTDGDGFSDFDEVRTYGSSPTSMSYRVTFSFGENGRNVRGDNTQYGVFDSGLSPRFPTVQAKEGYRFVGWEESIVPVTGEATYHAKYEEIVYWVDGINGSDANAGTNAATAFRTIQYAINNCGPIRKINVLDGVYEPFATTNRALTIAGVNGAAATIIDGGGTNRCATLGSTVGDTNVVLQGFTLRNGYANGASVVRNYGGGAAFGTLVDCKIYGNKASNGAGVYASNLSQCYVVGNTATGYGSGAYLSRAAGKALIDHCVFMRNRGSTGCAIYIAGSQAADVQVNDSLIVDNYCSRWLAVYVENQDRVPVLNNCTITGNSSLPSNVAGVGYAELNNCIVWGNKARPNNVLDVTSVNASYSCSSSSMSGIGNIRVDPEFVDDTRHVYELSEGSPCLDAGSTASCCSEVDVSGASRIAGASVDIGAYEGVRTGHVVGTEIEGFGAIVEPGAVVTDGGSISFTACEMGRPFVGFYTNGVFVTSDAHMTIEHVRNDIVVKAVFGPYTYYVDATQGNNNYSGLSWGSARRDISSAVNSAQDNDVVVVTNGVYSKVQTTGKRIRILSVEGPDATIIDGQGVSTVFMDYENGTIFTNAYIEGFTLRNGTCGAMGGALNRCIIKNNIRSDGGGGANGAELYNCVIADNVARLGGGAYNCKLVNCSILRNTASEWGGGLNRCSAVNCIVWSNTASGGGPNVYSSSLTHSLSTPRPSGIGNLDGDPLFVDASNGDYRLRVASPCLNSGDNSFFFGSIDYAGNAVDLSAVNVGAYQGEPVDGNVVSVSISGNGSVNNPTVVVDDGGSATISVIEGNRPFLYFEVDGSNRIYDASFVIPNIAEDHSVVAVFSNFTFYVDASSGRDANDGLSWNSAKLTLQNAIDTALEGESVRVADGVYSPISTRNKSVAISSVNGYKNTYIDGKGSTRCATLGASGGVLYTNTVLTGFSLINGYNYGSYSAYGGGSYCGTLNNCVISNCVAEAGSSNGGYDWAYGGGAYYGVLNNCLLVGNVVKSPYCSYGGGACSAVLNGCTLVDNSATYGTTSAGTGRAYGAGMNGGRAYNTIFANEITADVANCVNVPMYNCCVTDSASGYRYSGTIVADPLFADAEGGCYGLSPDSPCINSGDKSYVVGATDLNGKRRVQGLSVDMGCFEGASYTALPGEIVDVIASGGKLQWSRVAQAESYLVYRSETDDEYDAVLVGASARAGFEDATAEEGVTYWYWVRAVNPLGMGPMGEAAEMYWPDPLEITTGELPEGMEGEAYVVQLEATGGTGDYTWRVVADDGCAEKYAGTSTFEDVGAARGWRADDSYWSYSLPFAFPFFGNAYYTVYIGSNGTLSFGNARNSNSPSEDYLADSRMIAGYWRDLRTDAAGCDIFVDVGEDYVTFRWAATHYNGGTPVNFSITLYNGGAVRLSYGSGNSIGAMIGYSAGDGENYYISSYSQSGSMEDADDIWFFANLPPGISLSEDGVLSGTCSLVWDSEVTVAVEDELGETTEMTYSFVVNENPNARPEIISVKPDNASAINVRIGTTQSFEVEATDPEGESIEYVWYLDDVRQDVSAGSSTFAYSPVLADHGAHTLVCYVSDGYWTNKVFAAWQINACRDIYVDAHVGTVGAGFDWSSAMKSLQAACSYAVDGDQIFVADGFYEPITTSDKRITITSVNGAGATVIDGGNSNRCAQLSIQYTGTNTVLEGFSLINGFQGGSYYVYGGGSWGGTLNRCVISNCHIVASTGNNGYDVAQGGAAFYGVLNNCLIVNNSAVSPYSANGGGACGSKLVNCTVVGNLARGGTTTRGIGQGLGGGVNGGTSYNSIIAYNSADVGTNVYYSSMYYCCAPEDSMRRYAGTITDDPQFANATAGDYRLLATSPCRAAGSNEYVVGNKDLPGDARVHGGTVSMGCFESIVFTSLPSEVTGIVASEGALAWDSQVNAEIYRVYRNTSDDFSSATLVRTSRLTEWRDRSVVTDGSYWYWIVAVNSLGESGASASTRMLWPKPIVITTESLPAGMENVPYSFQLEAKDGTEPYSWSALAAGYSSMRTVNSFATGGTKVDFEYYSSKLYALPFEFTYYGRTYASVYVNRNGTLSFGSGETTTYAWDGMATLACSAVIAPMQGWHSFNDDDHGVFVRTDETKVTFRWRCENVYSDQVCNFSATLYANGDIRLSYGSGVGRNVYSGLSAGDGKRYIQLGNASVVGGGAKDFLLTPTLIESDADLPTGIQLTQGGLLTGTAKTTWTNLLTVAVTDFNGWSTNKTFELRLAANPNLRPVIDSVTPSTNDLAYVLAGNAQAFTVAAHDPESAELSYFWYVDGELVEDEVAASFTYRPTMDDYGYHSIQCFVSDGYWFDEVGCTWEVKVAKTIYVDQAAEGEGTGETLEDAYISIQDAMYETEEGDVIYVAQGTYEPFYCNSGTVTVKSLAGFAQTIIDCGGYYGIEGRDRWQPEYETDDRYTLQQPTIDGFTIKNASMAVYGAKVLNCKIVGSSTVAEGSQLENCIVTQNTSSDALMYRCRLVGCSVAGNQVGYYALGYGCRVYNSIVCGNTLSDGAESNYTTETDYEWDGTDYAEVPSTRFAYSCTYPLPTVGEGNIDSDPSLVDVRNGDLRLRDGSPCVDAAAIGYVATACDINGNLRVRDAGPDMGAIEDVPVAGFVISAEVIGGGTVSPMTAIATAGSDAVFVADDALRPFLGFETNGVWATSSVSFTWWNISADGILTAVFSNFTFYVDAQSGDDANDGLSWATAKRTLQEAVCAAVDGETILVKGGEYAPIQTENKKIRIVGVDGAESTIIDGASSERCATLSEAYTGTNTTIVGFTLRNGSAYEGGGAYGGTLHNCVITGNRAVQSGGGCAYTQLYDSQIVGNSVVVPCDTNRWGSYTYSPYQAAGGGVYNGRIVNCMVLENEIDGNPETRYVYGGGAAYSTAIGCVIADNAAYGYCYTVEGGGVYNSSVVNCTIVKNNVWHDPTDEYAEWWQTPDGGGYGGYYTCVNSIIYGNAVNGEDNDIDEDARSTYACIVGDDPGFVDYDGGDYTLTAGSPCIDSGYDYVYVSWNMPDCDISGNLRIQGSAIDIGAYETAREMCVEQTSIEVNSVEQQYEFVFRAGAAWTAETSASWFTIVNATGDASSSMQGITLNIGENDTGLERNAEMTLRIGSTEIVITVTQLAKVELPTATQTYYGLFVGLNEYTYASSLNGCVNDAHNMLSRCVSHGYWNEENVVALTNGQATKDAVREKIALMAQRAKAGDTVVFYQSSHGGNVSDSYGNMTDDVFLCEYDARYYDYELADDLSAFKSGVRVVVVIDACHSGGLFKEVSDGELLTGNGVQMSSGTSGSWNFAQRIQSLMKKKSARTKLILKATAKDETIDPSEIGWMTACDSDQYSYDSSEGGRFTVAMLDGWETGLADGEGFGDGDGYLNFYELFKYAHEYATGYGDTEAQCLNVGVLIKTVVGVPDGSDKPALPGLPEALDATNMVWTTSFGTGWFAQSDVTHDGVSAAQSGAIGNATSSVMSGTVSGSGTLTFWWKVSSEANKDKLTFSLDGEGQAVISGEQDWQQFSVDIDDEGDHVLTWTYAKNKSGMSGADCGWVDGVVWTPDVAEEEREVTLAEALDTTNVVWNVSGDADWRGVDNGIIDFARSGQIGDDEESVLSATLVGPGELTFRWKTSCEEYDGLDFALDGDVIRWVSGETDWTTVSLSLPAGSHTVNWIYWKDESDAEGDDCAYLDQVLWTSSASPAADPIPDIGEEPTAAQVQAALSGSEDGRLAENITDGDVYNAYREWANKVELPTGGQAGAQAVKDSPNAWLSFALDSATLIETLPGDGDVKIEIFEQASTSGSYDFSVKVEGLTIGSKAVEENLKTIFGLEGGTSLEDMSSDNVSITFGTPENGRVKFTAGPNAKNADAKAFFMKVKMTP